jgi:acetylornithine deacetylase/succinyl-diaminopimelate desuccinylase-like protein
MHADSAPITPSNALAAAPAVEAAACAAFPETLAELVAFLRIPSISCEPDHHPDVAALAEMVAQRCRDLGFSARLLQLPGALPCVSAEWMGAGNDAPTLLIYGHLDLQPVQGEPWTTPPHEGQVRGGRLYARGAADDMGGWMSHVAAISAWQKVNGGPPCNIRLLIEGEEEIGSPNLEAYMNHFPEAFAADVMVLTDCENPATHIPGLTVSLRGLLEVELSAEATRNDLHSGLFGNMIPDVHLGLIRLVARLTDENGRMKLCRQEVAAEWRASVGDLPLGPADLRAAAGLLPEVAPLPEDGRPAAEWLWRQPAVTVLASSLPDKAHKKNALRARGSLILSVRLAPGTTPEEMLRALEATLLVDPPAGLSITLRPTRVPGEAWLYEPRGAAFEAVDRATERVWGGPMVRVGIGGSIPFVALFGRRFSQLPLILNGVMDPATQAHGADESLDLGVFERVIRTNVWMYAELAALGRSTLADPA